MGHTGVTLFQSFQIVLPVVNQVVWYHVSHYAPTQKKK